MAGAGVCRIHQLVAQAKATFSLSKSEPKYIQELEKLRTIVRNFTCLESSPLSIATFTYGLVNRIPF